MSEILSADELKARLIAIGEERYHSNHPFHKLQYKGDLNKEQVKAWALNRYCYQEAIPRKDASILARLEDPALRRIWRQRIVDHDGEREGDGGIERWLRLTDGLGLDREYVKSKEGALPATRFAVEAYVQFVSTRSLLEAIASSLTELFSPAIISQRMSGMLANYDFVSAETLAYFNERLTQAPRDTDFALSYVLEHARTPETQAAVLNALIFKCNVLWSQLDALHFAYVEPGLVPPGAYQTGSDNG